MAIDTGGRKTVAPGDLVTIKGKATPGSFMAFRAVDKSVLLMKEDTDLSVAKVMFHSLSVLNNSQPFQITPKSA